MQRRYVAVLAEEWMDAATHLVCLHGAGMIPMMMDDDDDYNEQLLRKWQHGTAKRGAEAEGFCGPRLHYARRGNGLPALYC